MDFKSKDMLSNNLNSSFFPVLATISVAEIVTKEIEKILESVIKARKQEEKM